MILILIGMLLSSLIFAPVSAAAVELAETALEEIETGLRFSDMGWSSDEDDFFEYVPNEGVFERGTRVWAFLEVTGFESYFEDGYYYNDLAVDVYLKTGFGLRLFRQLDVIEFNDPSDQPEEYIWFYLWVDIPWWAPPGTYIAEVVVRDRMSSQEVIHAEKLRVR